MGFPVAAVIASVASSFVLGLFREKVKKPKAQEFTGWIAEEGRPIPYVAGVAELGGNTVWYGHVRRFGDEAPYQYLANAQITLCQGGPSGIDEILDIQWGKKSPTFEPVSKAQDSSHTATQTVSPSWPYTFAPGEHVKEFDINARQMFGGLDAEGGVEKRIRVYRGTRAQPVDELTAAAWAAAQLPNTTGTRRPGVCYLALGEYPDFHSEFYWGTTAQPKEITVVLRRNPRALRDMGLVAEYTDHRVGFDSNAMEIVWELSTDPDVGMGVPPTEIDAVSLARAAAVLQREGFGLSVVITDKEEAKAVIDEIMKACRGTFTPHPVTGLLTVTLARGPGALYFSYDVATLLEVSDDPGGNAQEIRETELNRRDIYNQVQLGYKRFAGGLIGGQSETFVFRPNVVGYQIYQTKGKNIVVTSLTANGDLVPANQYTVKRDTGQLIMFNTADVDPGDTIVVNYVSDPDAMGFVEGHTTEDNLADQLITGEKRPLVVDAPYITSDTAAQIYAAALKQTSTRPLVPYQWTMNRAGYALYPGAVCKLKSSRLGLLDFVVRVTNVDGGTLEKPEMTVTAVEDVWADDVVPSLPPEGGTSGGAPVDQAPSMAALYCAGEDTLGLQASDTSYNIEIWRADDVAGTNEELVEEIAGTSTSWGPDPVPGKVHKARQVREGAAAGPFTAWLAACPAGGSGVVCTLPELVPSTATADGEGTLSAALNDPQGRTYDVAFKTVSPDGVTTDYAADTAPYEAAVPVASGKTSYIYMRHRYYNCSGDLETRERVFSFTEEVVVPPGEDEDNTTGQSVCVDLDFHADGPGDWFVEYVPEELTEIDPTRRERFETFGFEEVGVVAVLRDSPGPANSFVAFKYLDDNGDWQWVGGEGGPALRLDQPVDTALESEFLPIPPEAHGRFTFAAFLVGGDGVTPVCFGKLALQFRRRSGVGTTAGSSDSSQDGPSPITPIDPGTVGGVLPSGDAVAWHLGDRGKVISVSGGGSGTVYTLDTETIDTVPGDLTAAGFSLTVTGDVPGATAVDTVVFESGVRSIRFDMPKPAWYSGVYYWRKTITGLAPNSTYTATIRCRVHDKPWFMTPIFRIGNGSSPGFTAGNDVWADLTATGDSDAGGNLTLDIGIPGDTFGAINWSCWFDDTLEITGEMVSGLLIRWRDQTPRANHLERGDDPTPVDGGDEVIFASGEKLEYLTALLQGTQPGEIMAVVRGLSAGPNGLWEFGGSGSPSLFPDAGGDVVDDFGSEAAKTGTTGLDLTEDTLVSVRSSGSGYVLLLNNVPVVNATPNVVAWATLMKVGGNVAFKEIAIWPRLLTERERALNMEAMKGRWNLTDVVTGVNDPNAGGSGGSGGDVPVPPTPVGGEKSLYLWGWLQSQWGGGYNGFNGTATALSNPATELGPFLAAAQAAGKRVILMTYFRSSVHISETDHRLSFSKFKAQIARWAGLEAVLKPYHDNGTFLGFMVVDEPYCGPCWGGQTIPNATVDLMCKEHRLLFPWARCYVRSVPTRMLGFNWLWATGCMCQWAGPYAEGRVEGRPDIQTYVRDHKAAAIQLGLTILWGYNGVAWRDYLAGTTTCASGVDGVVATRCRVTAATLERDGLYMAREEYSDGMYCWAVSNPPDDWMKRSDIGAVNVAIATELAS